MLNSSTTIIVVVLAYLIGSISFAIVVSKFSGLSDPRTYGSGNPGATNVFRGGGKRAAILTLLGDALKGWIAVEIALVFHVTDVVLSLVAIAVFLGHCWPVFFKFKGGKGVATAAGVLLGLNVWLGIATIITWLVIFYCFRYSSLAALISALFAPFYSALLLGIASPLFWAICVICIVLIARHHQNIRNLVAGKESRAGVRGQGNSDRKS